MNDIDRCYELLGLQRGASRQEVRQAYRDLAKVWHPDRFPNDPRLQRKAQDELKRINEAYAKLQSARPIDFARVWRPARSREPGSRAGKRERRSRWRPAGLWRYGQRLPSLRIAFWLAVTAGLCLSYYLYRMVPEVRQEQSKAPPPAAPVPAQDLKPAASTVSAPKSLPARTAKLPPKHFTLGSSRQQVLEAQGKPTRSDELVWEYESSRVFFEAGRVATWYSAPTAPLHVRLDPAGPVTVRSYFTLGSSKDEVLAVQGTPTEFTATMFKYGESRIRFSRGAVEAWHNAPERPLRVRIVPTSPVSSAMYFTIGSSKDEVAAIQGTPTELTYDVWCYGFSQVVFKDGRVVRWQEAKTNPLKAKVVSR